MLYPLLQLIVTQPQLLADHAEMYVELASSEMGAVTTYWKRRVMLNSVALCCVGVAAVLVGVALMLWAVTPLENIKMPWVLIGVPMVPLVAAWWCQVTARKQGDLNAFEVLRNQFKADVLMLREVSAS
jgi:hypothetical protein